MSPQKPQETLGLGETPVLREQTTTAAVPHAHPSATPRPQAALGTAPPGGSEIAKTSRLPRGRRGNTRSLARVLEPS